MRGCSRCRHRASPAPQRPRWQPRQEGSAMGEFSVAVLCLAGFVFAVSSAMKLRSRRAYMSFRDGLGETGLVPGRLLPFTAAALCWVEAVTGAGLLAAAALTAVAASGAAPLA